MGNTTRRSPPRPIRKPPCSGLNASTRASSDKRSTEDASGVLWRKAPRLAETMNSAPRAAGPTRQKRVMRDAGTGPTGDQAPNEAQCHQPDSETDERASRRPAHDRDDEREGRHQERPTETQIAPHADQRPHHDGPAHGRKGSQL